jgi:hypothetical protein
VSCEPVTRLLYQCVVNEAQHYVPMIVLGMALLAIGGLPFVMWGIFLRTVLGLHGCYQCCRATHVELLAGSFDVEKKDFHYGPDGRQSSKE